ncbi:intein-containing pachytene checkpoint protein precursor [Anaeramoeba ignava]|uniref:Intein-containing pachytene checkpoint protein n=1 Tax=Anaeramoeba ignava TaxID=1746090 RepID=A0A9Q0RF92_ANAIG|nr:intein-containing pachytene checkpoint protein precursor [Anaeramoeba ignava]
MSFIIEIEVEISTKSYIEFSTIKELIYEKIKNEKVIKILEKKTINFSNEKILNENVEKITVNKETQEKENLSIDPNLKISEVETKIYVYQLNEEPILEENVDSEDADLSACFQWILPSKQFNGLWESLFFEENLKQNLINYILTTVLFSEKKVDSNLISFNRVVLFHGPSGTGKCLAPGTSVLMFDGGIKKVEDVLIGDQLMGDDSNPRNVLSICCGKDQMYKIIPKKGQPWICNEPHILCLKKKSQNDPNYNDQNSIIEISVKDYLQKSSYWKSHYKLYKTYIDFIEKEVDLDPYIVGYLLGNCSCNSKKISIENDKISQYFSEYLKNYHLCLEKEKNGEYNIYIQDGKKFSAYGYEKNLFYQRLLKYNLGDHKRIPIDYKCNSRNIRLSLLAGLFDSFGSYENNCYKFCGESEKLIEDIIYIARSLGFSAEKKDISSKSKNSNENYECFICGSELEELPILSYYKKGNPQKNKSDCLLTEFEIESVGIGEYFGFEIDGNGRFLLGDFTVTHNTSLCRALSQKLSIKFSNKYAFCQLIEINTHSLFSKWFSESGKLVMKLFKKIRELIEDQGSFVFLLIDEVESLATARKSAMSGAEPSDAIRVVNALLTQIRSTQTISKSFVDRADLKQYIGLPTQKARYEILRSCTEELMRVGIITPRRSLLDCESIELLRDSKKNETTNSSLLFYQIAEKCEGYSGRTLRKLPLITHSFFLQKPIVSISEFISAFFKAVEKEKIDRSKLEFLN